MKYVMVVLCACSLAITSGCGGDGGGGDGGVCNTAECLTAEGWTLFEQGNIDGAIAKFTDAIEADPGYADAYNGLGWSYANKDALSEALENFGRCITSGMTTADPYAGCAPVYRDAEFVVDYFDSAIVVDSTALAKDPDYEFSHDKTFNSDDLHLILAQSYYGDKRYLEAKDEVEFLGGPVLDPEDEYFVRDLGAAIQDLENSIGG
jgi:tetratricopeptide (TPR) repeat protein